METLERIEYQASLHSCPMCGNLTTMKERLDAMKKMTVYGMTLPELFKVIDWDKVRQNSK